jgi:hypothetical protein
MAAAAAGADDNDGFSKTSDVHHGNIIEDESFEQQQALMKKQYRKNGDRYATTNTRYEDRGARMDVQHDGRRSIIRWQHLHIGILRGQPSREWEEKRRE